MKTLLYSCTALAALALSALGQGVAVRLTDLKLEKVSPSVVKTPEYQIVSGQNKRFKNGEWLEVEVEFSTAAELIDELTFAYKMQINGKLVVGEVTHINIPKGREHFSVAYVAPRSLEALMGGKQMTPASIQGIWVDVSHAGQQLATLGMNKGVAAPNLPHSPEPVLNKTQTPFAPLYWDRYEAIKPGGR